MSEQADPMSLIDKMIFTYSLQEHLPMSSPQPYNLDGRCRVSLESVGQLGLDRRPRAASQNGKCPRSTSPNDSTTPSRLPASRLTAAMETLGH